MKNKKKKKYKYLYLKKNKLKKKKKISKTGTRHSLINIHKQHNNRMTLSFPGML